MVLVAAATVPLPVAWHSTHSGQTHSTPRPPQARRSRPPRRHRVGAAAGPRQAATVHGFRAAVAQWLDLATPPHGLSSRLWSPGPTATATRLALDAGARLRPARATATRARAGGKSSSSSARKTEATPDVDGGMRPGRPRWPGGGADAPAAARETESCARARGSGVVGRVTGGCIGADICKGISVISHTHWFACPGLDVQILLDGGSTSETDETFGTYT